MKRTIIQLPDELFEYLRKLAFKRRISIAELVRQIVTSYKNSN